MKTNNKGKHLTLISRRVIGNGLGQSRKLIEIANLLGVDPTTISKEIKRNRIFKFDNRNICPRTNRYPYVCNDCKNKYKSCGYRKYEYIPDIANNKALTNLVVNRSGINISKDDFDTLDKLIKEGVEDNKSIYDICKSNKDIKVSVPTVYRYINKKYLTTKRIDLPRACKLKVRKKALKKYDYPENTKFSRNNRTYLDYLTYKFNHPGLFHVEMDYLGVIKSDSNTILTLTIKDIEFIMIFLVKKYSMNDLMGVFNYLEVKLGIDNFKRVFPYILTDRDYMFTNYEKIEFSSITGEERTHLFYCDAFRSNQKANVENINSQLRLFFPKGKSIDKFTKNDIKDINYRLNSRRLHSLSGSTANEAFVSVYGEEVFNKLY